MGKEATTHPPEGRRKCQLQSPAQFLSLLCFFLTLPCKGVTYANIFSFLPYGKAKLDCQISSGMSAAVLSRHVLLKSPIHVHL